jgi:hypothetical protein
VRTYGDAIDVRTGADALSGSDAPAQFLWRGRLYLVRDVLAHWVELGAWWSVRGSRAPRAVAAAAARAAGPRSGSGAAPPSSGVEPTRSVSADVGAVEREVWRVEASFGRLGTRGVYDLVRDLPTLDPLADPAHPPAPARWHLARALD